MTSLIHDDIFWFQISVDDHVFVESFQSEKYLGNIDSGNVFGELFVFLEETTQVTSRTVF